MKFEGLFDVRMLAAEKVKQAMRTHGYTKSSFSKLTGISRPTLDKVLNAELDNKSTFDKHMQKILNVLNMGAEDLLTFRAHPQKVEAVFSDNAPGSYHMSEKAQKQHELLEDVIHLCTIYYERKCCDE